MNLIEFVKQSMQFHKQSLLIVSATETYLACNKQNLNFRESRKAPTFEPNRRVYSHAQAKSTLSLTTVYMCDSFPTYMATKVMILTEFNFQERVK